MQHWQRSVVPMSKSAARDIVLVVDDSPDTLRMLTDAIEEAGMTVLVAREGAQALAMIARVTPDVILMDAVMPGMDGYECCRQLKDNPATLHIPVVMVTALGEPGERLRGLEAGADDFLTKPVDYDTLVARVRSLVRLKRLLDEWRARGDGLLPLRIVPPVSKRLACDDVGMGAMGSVGDVVVLTASVIG